MKRRMIRFGIVGVIIILENSLQMCIFYDDQLAVGLTWSWWMPLMPMLSNVLFSKWCATIGPAVKYIYKDHK